MNVPHLLWLLVCGFAAMVATAQPGAPDIDFTLVIDDRGTPMPGIHAEDMITRHDLTRQGKEPWSVEEHFTNADPNMPSRNGEHVSWIQAGTSVPGLGRRRLQFHFIDCWCTGHYMRVQRGAEHMRIDLPDPPAERWALVQHVMQRSGDLASPEVIRFRPGRFTFSELMNDPAFDELEGRIARRLKDEENAGYKKQLAALEQYYRTRVPSAPPAPSLPPRQPTPDEIAQEVASRPGLKKVSIARTRADSVWVKITGRVMLDGGCASSGPMFGIEMHTDSGWVERHAMREDQMDCGMPWADWDDHEVRFILGCWVRANSPEGRKELAPGSYRLVFMGANQEHMRSEEFFLD